MTTILPRVHFLGQLGDLILKVKRDHPIRVAIDGLDAAGKTILADELAPTIKKSGRHVIRISVDDFHRPRRERYRRGEFSPVGYYHDSFDYQAIQKDVLKPLGTDGNRRFKRAIFDFRTDTSITEPFQVAPQDAVLLMDGVFLLRSDLLEYWDYRIFVMVDNEVALRRAIKRDQDLFPSPELIIKRYRERYFPGQKLYLQSVDPLRHADVLINNNTPEELEVIFANRVKR